MRCAFILGLAAIPGSAEPPAVRPYGVLELDVTKDSNTTALGSAATANSLWDLAVRPSLLGVRFTSQGPLSSSISGKVEADFNGSGGSASSPQPRMRHAYVQMEWPSGFSLLVGQTDDIAAPLTMDTISYPLESLTGDLGHRRPQIRATQVLRLGAHRMTFQVAASTAQADLDRPLDTGSNHVSIPIGLARIAFTAGAAALPRATLGIYGHVGSANFTFDAQGSSERVRSWSGGLDLKAEFTPAWTLTGEAWRGVTLDLTQRNQDALVLAQRRQGIHAQGGWAAITWAPRPGLRMNLGTGHQRIRAEDVPSGQAQHIVTSFGNVFYDPLPPLELGLEVSRWSSPAFLNVSAQDKIRTQLSFVYKF